MREKKDIVTVSVRMPYETWRFLYDLKYHTQGSINQTIIDAIDKIKNKSKKFDK